jgi:hypothetical protein
MSEIRHTEDDDVPQYDLCATVTPIAQIQSLLFTHTPHALLLPFLHTVNTGGRSEQGGTSMHIKHASNLRVDVYPAPSRTAVPCLPAVHACIHRAKRWGGLGAVSGTHGRRMYGEEQEQVASPSGMGGRMWGRQRMELTCSVSHQKQQTTADTGRPDGKQS